MKEEINKILKLIKKIKILDDEKPFLIVCILLVIKHKRKIYNNKDVHNEILNQLELSNIPTSNFSFLNSKKYFFELYEYFISIYPKLINEDIINIFYQTIMKNCKKDSKVNGIVLTPSHIVKFMIKLLNIQNNDTILDICTGTGSFLLEASLHKPKKIIGCEVQYKLFLLCKYNFILHDIENYELFNNNCFKLDFNANKAIINPPYNLHDEKEFDFIFKLIDNIDNLGLICVIIPITKLSNSKSNNCNKKKLLELVDVLYIIECDMNIFYPLASIQTCILLLKKIDNKKENNKTKYVNNKLNIKNYSYENIINDYEEINLNYNEDWIIKNSNTNLNEFDINKMKISFLENKYIEMKNELKELNIIKFKNYKVFKIKDLFYILTKPREIYKEDKEINYISATKYNNGIKKRISSNKRTFTGNKITLISSGNGGAGLAFYQKKDFSISNVIKVLEPKNIILDEKIGIFISNLLSKNKEIYSYSFIWNKKRIYETEISLPVTDEDNIDYEYIKNIFY